MPVVNVYGTNDPDTLTGTDDTNNIYGYGGDDHLYGLGGSDALIGGPGADTMEGGTGNDGYFLDNSGDRVIEKAGEGLDVVQTSANWVATAGSEIEEIDADGPGKLQLTGNTHSDAYSLIIRGNFDVNVLDDGGGRASLIGGYGSDVYVVTNELTRVLEFDGFTDYDPGHFGNPLPPPPDPLLEGYDTVRTNLGIYTLPDNVEKLVYFGTDPFSGTGNAENNDISGGVGNDTLDGAAGGDRLTGGQGDDTYYVDDAKDAVIEKPGEGRDIIYATGSSYIVQPNTEVLIYLGNGAFTGYGSAAGHDTIIGGDANDTLFGGAGPDDIYGGGGQNLLRGGGGADVFVLTPSLSGVQRILDFQHGVDKIGVDDAKFVSDVGLAPLSPDLALIHEYFTYDQASGKLYVHTDSLGGDRDYTSKLVATFDNHPVLTNSDFVTGYSLYDIFPLGL